MNRVLNRAKAVATVFRTLPARRLRACWILYKAKPFTMVSVERLLNVFDLCSVAEDSGLAGAFVECGVWRGGCSAVMAYVAQFHNSGRPIHLFDSFEGLPVPRLEVDGEDAVAFCDGRADGSLASTGKCLASLEDVRSCLFDRIGVRPAGIFFHQGWFQHVLPVESPLLGPIAVLRLDADWYDSTRICLDYLFPKVVPNGFVIIDDYYQWPGCRIAVDEYLSRNDLEMPLVRIDADAVYFQKPAMPMPLRRALP